MIGIVGGAGPLAGAELFRKIIEETEASHDQDHLPVLLWSVPAHIPDRTEYLEGRVRQNPAKPISQIFLQLEKMGATVAAIPCNTAHVPAIFDEIRRSLGQAGSQLKLLNIIDETVRFLKENYANGTVVGVLSTTGTWRMKTYSNALKKAGFKVLTAESEKEQGNIHSAVYDKDYGIKATGTPVSAQAREVLYIAAEQLIDGGAEVIVLGCTEIPIALTKPFIGEIRMVDTVRVLARALVRELSPEKLKNRNR